MIGASVRNVSPSIGLNRGGAVVVDAAQCVARVVLLQ